MPTPSLYQRSLESPEPAQVVAQYVWGARPSHRDELVLRDRATVGGGSLDERLYCLMDYYNPVAVVDTTGEVKERYAWSAFGLRSVMAPNWAPRAESEFDWSFAFHGQFLDDETGYYDYGYRYYSPELGRWLSRDPIGERGGVNLYLGFRCNAINRHDRLGLQDYVNQTAAARAGISENFHASQTETVEYGGLVCKSADTSRYIFTVTKGKPINFFFINKFGEDAGLRMNPEDAPCPENFCAIAAWHTHPFIDVGHRRLNWRNKSIDPTFPIWESYQELLEGADGISDALLDTGPETERLSGTYYGDKSGDTDWADSHGLDIYVGTASGKFFHYDHNGKYVYLKTPGFNWNYRPEGSSYILPNNYRSPEEWATLHPDIPNPPL